MDRRQLFAGLAVTVFIGLLAACQSAAEPGTGPSSPGESSAPSLLGAGAVDGEAVAPSDRVDFASLPCRVDRPSLVPHLAGENKVVYQRHVDDGVGRVVIGAWRQEKREAHETLQKISSRVQSTECAPETGLSQGIAGYFDYPAIAFETSLFASRDSSTNDSNAHGRRISIKKVYTYHDGFMVTVWLERAGSGDPSTNELKSLLDQQLDLLA